MKLKQANDSLFIAVVTVTLLETLLSNFVGRTQLKMHVSRSVCILSLQVVCVCVYYTLPDAWWICDLEERVGNYWFGSNEVNEFQLIEVRHLHAQQLALSIVPQCLYHRQQILTHTCTYMCTVIIFCAFTFCCLPRYQYKHSFLIALKQSFYAPVVF